MKGTQNQKKATQKGTGIAQSSKKDVQRKTRTTGNTKKNARVRKKTTKASKKAVQSEKTVVQQQEENTQPQQTSYTNRQYKDRLFKFIFKDKERLLSLYNALNSSHYTNPEDIEITTLEDVIYCNMKNDVSFIIDDRLSLFEHQSTYNPNMPLRGFLYFAKHF